MTPELFGDRIREVESVQKKLTSAIEHTVGLRVPVRLVEPNAIARSEGKAKRVIDQRSEKEEL
jgi:phenylacetate-CoA ligase